jgi:hypothetical protein
MTSIHEKGRSAIDAFVALWPADVRIVRGPAAGRRAKQQPDCVVTIPDAPLVIGVEVKKSTTSAAQMRPLDYLTTVVWRAGEGWWVLPPHDVLRLALDYAGQHCTSSFECFNPGKPNAKWAAWKCDGPSVPRRVREAFEAGEKSPAKHAVAELRREIADLYGAHKQRIAAVVASA